jgi:phenylalanyl-tRNA synthetase beta chain
VDEGIPANDILRALETASRAPVDAVRIFDVYRGPGIGAGKKSLAILVLMQDTARTLTDAEIDAAVAGLLRVLVERFGATLRSQDRV